MRHVRIVSKASGKDTPGAVESLLSIFSVIISMATLILQWKDLMPQE
ncbi:MAG TPA: hypothetical protein PKO36_10840 [Candidatus Hydrogenedentes bacterium]|nr:hypothetical protein [Candidatus Hydrogenedentota bacterium]HOT50241.1 hypothetical protein [Candidatus Hydrogenedentota bacterium]HOV72748.1 hypothetical protein [Candidatus Hydrogenedentota bacterium]HPC17841.1 hypothetical protein [Candidatus Hydrogenedentota bacterium]HRT21742.1 hypothetical protein [Candidatus Hydrogenedentota bacterium]